MLDRMMESACANTRIRFAMAAGLGVSLIGMQVMMVGVALRFNDARQTAAGRGGSFRQLATASETCPNFAGAPFEGKTAVKALPSLNACQMYTEKACCVAGHDQDVMSALGDMLPASCEGNYDVLTEFMCMGCSSTLDKYITYYNEGKTWTEASDATGGITAGDKTAAGIDKATHATTANAKVQNKIGEIRLCESFARNLFYDVGDDGTQVSDSINAYDACALNDPNSGFRLGSQMLTLDATTDFTGPEGARVPIGFGDTPGVIKLSPELKFFSNFMPPGFHQFEVSWYHDTDCYGAASSNQLGSMAAFAIAFIAYVLA